MTGRTTIERPERIARPTPKCETPLRNAGTTCGQGDPVNSDIERTGNRLWSICNGTAAFSGVQFVSLFFAVAQTDFRKSVAAPGILPTVVVFILMLAALQIGIIHWCNRHLEQLERSNNDLLNRIGRSVGRGRILTVIFFTLLGIAVLFIGPFSTWLSVPPARTP
jgi:hypothetical protein